MEWLTTVSLSLSKAWCQGFGFSWEASLRRTTFIVRFFMASFPNRVDDASGTAGARSQVPITALCGH